MSAHITIVGLGPGRAEYWTRAAENVLHSTDEVYLRTRQHPSVAEIPAKCHDFDAVYRKHTAFEQAYEQVTATIIQQAQRPQGVVYAVPGHPHVGEATVPMIEQSARALGLTVKVIPGLSFIEPTLSAFGLNGIKSLQIVDGVELAERYHPPLSPDGPALVTRLYGVERVARIKKTLLNAYPPDLEVGLIRAAGTDEQIVWFAPLQALVHQPYLDEFTTTLYLPADERQCSFATFQNTIAHLRHPEHGCPWDMRQTHHTLRPFLLEEAHEVLEAIDADDPSAMADEFGDLLLQIVLHAQIATDNGTFQMGDVVTAIQRKMVRRHPHVFGEAVINDVEALKQTWAAIKQAEQAEKGIAEQRESALDGIPISLPALAQASVISQKAARTGFEWQNIEQILAKVTEEAEEIAQADTPRELEAEIGDLLFTLVNLARWKEVDPESALRSTNTRFRHRFKHMEQVLRQQGLSLKTATYDQRKAAWETAKRLA